MTTDVAYPLLEQFLAVQAKNSVLRPGVDGRKKIIRTRPAQSSTDLVEPDHLVGLADELRSISSLPHPTSALQQILDRTGFHPSLPETTTSLEEWLVDLSQQLELRVASHASELRTLLKAECGRIGAEELATRTLLGKHQIAEFLEGARPSRQLLKTLEAYEFGEYRDLSMLMNAHFYEGFADHGVEDWKGAVAEFVTVSTPGLVRGAITDIGALLARVQSETDLRLMMDAMGSYFAPEMDGLTYREWLRAMQEQLLRTTI